MKEIEVELVLPEGKFITQVLEFEESDRSKLYNIYQEWRNLCIQLNKFKARGINLPEGLSYV